MKINYLFVLGVLLSFFSNLVIAQSNWEHVGPISSNLSGGNLYETSQLNFIEIDPNNPDNMICGGRYAGLWKSINGGNEWEAIETSDVTGSNGVSSICYLNSSEIILSNYFYVSSKNVYSTGVWKYNLGTNDFTSLGSLPNPENYKFHIRSITKHPQFANILFVSTSIGLYRSTNTGSTWTKITNNHSENVVFVPVGSGFHCFSGGCSDMNETGDLSIKKSIDNGATFTDISSSFSVPSNYRNFGYARLTVKPSVAGSDSKLLVYNLAKYWTGDYLEGDEVIVTKAFLHGVDISFSSGSIAFGPSTFLPNATFMQDGSIGRLGFEYDPINNGVWFGGIVLSYYNLENSDLDFNYFTNTANNLYGNVHSDIHYVKCVNNKIYVACDGGINYANDVSSNITSVYFQPINNGIDVALVNGFSGTDDNPSLYAIEQQDIVNLDIFESNTGIYTPKYTHKVWESDGPIIDKFNQSYIIADQSSYSESEDVGYKSSNNGGATLSGIKQYYYPITSSINFENSFEQVGSGAGERGFVARPFQQDPYRPERIYRLKMFSGIYQYIKDPVNDDNSAFVQKIWPGDLTPLGIIAWNSPTAMSFSPQTKNSLHITFNGIAATTTDPFSPPTVIKYIGPDIDDCWRGHNAFTTSMGGSTVNQWATITSPAIWSSLGITLLQQETMEIHSIETSPWNKDVVYILVKISGHDEMKVLKYNGTDWSNYSNGIPNDLTTFSMIMDRQSNDGIYISTEFGVYYRSAYDSQWNYYSTNLPHLKAPQMEINYAENTVRAGTWGRGIYKSNLYCPSAPLTKVNCMNCDASTPNNYWEGTTVSIASTTINNSKRIVRASEYILITPGIKSYTLLTPNGNDNNYFFGYIHGCGPTTPNSFKMDEIGEVSDVDFTPYLSSHIFEKNGVIVYPNPNKGNFKININDNDVYDIIIYNQMGVEIKSIMQTKVNDLEIELNNVSSGLYILKCISLTKILSTNFVID